MRSKLLSLDERFLSDMRGGVRAVAQAQRNKSDEQWRKLVLRHHIAGNCELCEECP